MIENKNIVLTGASSGIGLETLKILMKGAGNRILAVARHTDNLYGISANVIPFNCDVSTQQGVDAIFAKATELFGKIDIFYANAGFPYYEEFNYENWDRVKTMFDTNSLSPIYTYVKYIHHLNGREGILAYTVSAIGQMAMPGYAIYSSSKFALHGFQQAIRLEKPKNLQLTCLYPVATDTNFFKVANALPFEKPFPVQNPKNVAKKMVAGIESGKEFVYPCGLFSFAKVLMAVVPPVKTVYWGIETKKLERFKAHIRENNEKILEDLKEVTEDLREARLEVKDKIRENLDEAREFIEKEKEKI